MNQADIPITFPSVRPINCTCPCSRQISVADALKASKAIDYPLNRTFLASSSLCSASTGNRIVVVYVPPYAYLRFTMVAYCKPFILNCFAKVVQNSALETTLSRTLHFIAISYFWPCMSALFPSNFFYLGAFSHKGSLWTFSVPAWGPPAGSTQSCLHFRSSLWGQSRFHPS